MQLDPRGLVTFAPYVDQVLKDRSAVEALVSEVLRLRFRLAEFERQFPDRNDLISHLIRNRWNIQRTAEALRIPRTTLQYRMRKHGLSGPRSKT